VNHEILMAGFGGQGIMLMGQMLTYAGMKDDRHVSWMPSYGPEQRGGTANCGVVISDEPVASPVVSEPTVCVVMNEPSLAKFADSVSEGGYLLINESLIQGQVDRNDIQVIRIPVTDEAEKVGNVRVANMIMLGALAEATGVVTVEQLKDVLSDVLPERRHSFIPINIRALERGAELVSRSDG